MKSRVLRYGLLIWTFSISIVVGVLLYLNVQVHPIPESQFFFNMSRSLSLSEWIRVGSYYLVGNGSFILPLILFVSFNSGLPFLYLVHTAFKERGLDTHIPAVMMGITFISSLPPYEVTPVPRFIFWFVSMTFLSLVVASLAKPLTKYSYSL